MGACLPLGKENFLSFKWGQESNGVGGLVLEFPTWEHVLIRVGACVLRFQPE